MDDLDIIAILTPAHDYRGRNAEIAFGQRHNAARYHEGTEGSIATEQADDSRDPTPAPTPPLVERSGCLVLRFSDFLINAAEGVLFGKHEHSCDILIHCRGVRGVSGRHFAIVVKEDSSWYLEDFFSTHGTAVSYDGKTAHHKRKHERWIIAHPSKSDKQWNELIVCAGDVAFEIDFPNQAAGYPTYQANLEAFIRKSREALPGLGVLGLDSHDSTATPSQVATPDPSRHPIYVEYEEVGRGAFAKVVKVMSNRDGIFYAMKKFFRPSEGRVENGRKRRRDSDAWLEKKRKEADIMRNSAHVRDRTGF